MKPTQKAVIKLRTWLAALLNDLPSNIGLIYVEWNECGNAQGNIDWIQFFAAGYCRSRVGNFNPEDPDDLGMLGDWDWENPASCIIPKAEIGSEASEDLKKFFEETVTGDSRLTEQYLSRKISVAHGEHESEVFLVVGFLPEQRPDQMSSSRFCYELHDRLQLNSIVKYSLGNFVESPLLAFDKVLQPWPDEGIFFLLEENGRPTDILCSNRWNICSEKLTKLFMDNTDKIQVFPAPLFKQNDNGRKPIKGYFVVNLYEKLDCIPDEYVEPAKYRGGAKTFNPGKGYKLHWPAISGKNVFRLNYEHHRLLVSQKLRNEFDKQKITGVQWLRREVVNWPA